MYILDLACLNWQTTSFCLSEFTIKCLIAVCGRLQRPHVTVCWIWHDVQIVLVHTLTDATSNCDIVHIRSTQSLLHT